MQIKMVDGLPRLWLLVLIVLVVLAFTLVAAPDVYAWGSSEDDDDDDDDEDEDEDDGGSSSYYCHTPAGHNNFWADSKEECDRIVADMEPIEACYVNGRFVGNMYPSSCDDEQREWENANPVCSCPNCRNDMADIDGARMSEDDCDEYNDIADSLTEAEECQESSDFFSCNPLPIGPYTQPECPIGAGCPDP